MIYSITEGQQAEEYKARKAKEAEDAKKADDERVKRRFTAGISKYDDGTHPTKSVNLLKSDKEVHPDDSDRYLRSRKAMNNEIKRRENELVAAHQDPNKSVQKAANNLFRLNTNTYNMMATRDATNRHIRRHPNQYKESCGLFANVSFI